MSLLEKMQSNDSAFIITKAQDVKMSNSSQFYFETVGENSDNYEVIEENEVEFNEKGEISLKYEDNGSPLMFADDMEKDPKTGLLVPKKQSKTTKTSPILIKYKYALRPDAPALRGESRDFCKRMMDLADSGKIYSKNEILNNPNINRNDMETGGIIDNTSAWFYRGGWYTNPNTDIAVPFCRHRWVQILVRPKQWQ